MAVPLLTQSTVRQGQITAALLLTQATVRWIGYESQLNKESFNHILQPYCQYGLTYPSPYCMIEWRNPIIALTVNQQ